MTYFDRFGELVKISQKLAPQAEQQYEIEVEAILQSQSHDPQRIERFFGGNYLTIIPITRKKIVVLATLVKFKFGTPQEFT